LRKPAPHCYANQATDAPVTLGKIKPQANKLAIEKPRDLHGKTNRQLIVVLAFQARFD
jgi:hypothetical protein